jgi:hypothetical protein
VVPFGSTLIIEGMMIHDWRVLDGITGQTGSGSCESSAEKLMFKNG